MTTEKPGIQPTDHLPKKQKPEKITMTLGEGDTAREVPGKRVVVNGITVDVADEALDDFEFLDDLRASKDEGDASRFPSLMRRFLGDQYKAVLDQLRGPNGRVPIQAGMDFVNSLFEVLNPNS